MPARTARAYACRGNYVAKFAGLRLDEQAARAMRLTGRVTAPVCVRRSVMSEKSL